MILRQVIEPAPNDQPQKSEQAGNNKSRTRAPAEVEPRDKECRDSAADRGAAVKQRCGQAALLLGKPLRNGFRCAGPIAGFAESEEKTETHERVEASGERRENGNNRIPKYSEREPALRADAIHQPAVESLPDGIGYAERDH